MVMRPFDYELLLPLMICYALYFDATMFVDLHFLSFFVHLALYRLFPTQRGVRLMFVYVCEWSEYG